MTRSVTVKDLNLQQAQFVTAFLELGGRPQDGAEAAMRAGYATTREDAEFSARILLESRKVAEAIRHEVLQRFSTAAGVALQAIVGLCQTGRSEQVRLAAAKELLDRGIGPIMSRNATMHVRAVTVEEFLARMEGRLEGDGSSAPAIDAEYSLAAEEA